MEEGMGGGRRKRETTEIKTRELLASSLVSPFSLQLPISLPPLLSLLTSALFLPLSRYVSATETKKCNLPLLGDTLPRATQPSLVRLAPPLARRG